MENASHGASQHSPYRCAARMNFFKLFLEVTSSEVSQTLQQGRHFLVVSGTARWRSVLLNFFFGLVRGLLLFLQVGDGGRIRCSGAVRILPGIGGRASGNAILALILGK